MRPPNLQWDSREHLEGRHLWLWAEPTGLYFNCKKRLLAIIAQGVRLLDSLDNWPGMKTTLMHHILNTGQSVWFLESYHHFSWIFDENSIEVILNFFFFFKFGYYKINWGSKNFGPEKLLEWLRGCLIACMSVLRGYSGSIIINYWRIQTVMNAIRIELAEWFKVILLLEVELIQFYFGRRREHDYFNLALRLT